MIDIVTWLRQLGLERYEATFRDNEVTADVLRDLTEADLEKLGLPLGPRKKLLKAIAALDAELVAAETSAAAPAHPMHPNIPASSSGARSKRACSAATA